MSSMAAPNPNVTRYAPLAVRAGRRFGVDPALLLADINQESGGQEATSSAGARGRTQFIPSTAAEYGVQFGNSPAEIESQIRGQAHYLSNLGAGKNAKAALEGYLTGKSGDPVGESYADSVLAQVPAYRAAVRAAGGSGGALLSAAGAAPGASPALPQVSPTPMSSSELSSLMSSLQSVRTVAPEATQLQAPEASARPALPEGFKVPSSAGVPVAAAKPDLSAILASLTGASSGASTGVSGGAAPKGAAKGAGGSAVAFAEQHLGKYAENLGPNEGTELDQLEARVGLRGEPWCAIFATTAAVHGGASLASRTASVAQINEWAQQGSHGYQRGLLPTSQARPGDLITFGNEHVGVVKSVGRGRIVTIEGNANGAGGVREVVRNSSEGRIARPRYGGPVR